MLGAEQVSGFFPRNALDAHIQQLPKDVDALLLRAYLHLASGERKPAQELIYTILELRPADETAPMLSIALLPPPPPPKQGKPVAPPAPKADGTK